MGKMFRELILGFIAVGVVLAAVQTESVTGRIINGHEATSGQFPWAGFFSGNNRLCSCVLVSVDWALTAGHCAANAVSGDLFFGDPRRGGDGEVHRNFVDVILHPNYRWGGSYDIAMLSLLFPYELSDTIQTIALPNHEDQWFENRWGFITGYGVIETVNWVRPEVLQFAPMRALPRDVCNQIWPAHADLFVCPYSGHSSICYEDSGGGFAIHDGGAWILVGVASLVHTTDGTVCGDTSSIGFVRVAGLADWIRSVMG